MLTLFAVMMLGASADNGEEALAQVQLPDAPGLYERWDPERSFGNNTLIKTLKEAAAHMAWHYPEIDPILVGDLSLHGGGPMYGHSTHDRGIDADLGLFHLGGYQPRSFLDVAPHRLDVEHTWELIDFLLQSGQVHYILLDKSHIATLKRYLTEQKGYSQTALDGVFPPEPVPWNLMGIVRHAPNHRSHIHVRVGPPTKITKPVDDAEL